MEAICTRADYYNNERYQWNLARLAPTKYYRYLMTGKYPLSVPLPKTNRYLFHPLLSKAKNSPCPCLGVHFKTGLMQN